MKYLKKFTESQSYITDPDFIREYLINIGAKNWQLNADGSYDVEGNIDIRNSSITMRKLPIQFNHVKGDFSCNSYAYYRRNGTSLLTTLEGCPRIVDGVFDCAGNRDLTSLEGGPESCGKLNIIQTGIKNLVGSPRSVLGVTQIETLPALTSLQGGPDLIQGDIFIADCRNLFETGGWNPMVNGDVNKSSDNYKTPLVELMCVFQDVKATDYYPFFESVALYDYIRGNTVNKKIFEQACRDYEVRMPSELINYIWV